MFLPVWLVVAAALHVGLASAASFPDAATARAKMEEIVSGYASTLESMYNDMTAEEKMQCTGGYGYVESCDPSATYSSAWAAAMQSGNPKRFNNPTTETCTRFDKDESNRFLSKPRTGRKNHCNEPGNCKEPGDYVDCTQANYGDALYNSKCKCHYNVVTPHPRSLHANSIRKDAYLENTGCISSSDKTQCTVNQDEYGINFPTSVDLTNSRMCAEIAASSRLVDEFKSNAATYDDLQWTFSGMQETGLYRNWPLIYQCRTEAQCSGCSDPRFRNWYAEAASGPKDVVIILDTSGSMGGHGRFALMQNAAKWVVNTLTKYDAATIVSFSSSATAIDWGGGDTTMRAMDDVGRALMKDFIDGLYVGGATNMPAAFETAFDVLDATQSAGAGSGCGLKQTVILFLTDGENSASTDPNVVLRLRNTNDYNARVFTYSLGANTGGSDTMMQQLACSSGGVWSKVADGGDLEKTMAQYFMYLSAGIAKDNATVRWSDWFEDGQGLGQIIGACAPVYDRAESESTGVSIMFGVICVSIHKDTWEGYSDHAAVMGAIEAADRQCPVRSLTEAQMAVVRGRMHHGQSCTQVTAFPTAYPTFSTEQIIATDTGNSASPLLPALQLYGSTTALALLSAMLVCS